MTVTTTESIARYRGNGVTTEFAFNFIIPSADVMRVTLEDYTTGVVVDTLDPVDFSATGFGDPTGGEVVYNPLGVPLSNAFNIVIERVVPYEQGLSIKNQSTYYPDRLEAELDLIVMQVQQVYNRLVSFTGELTEAIPAIIAARDAALEDIADLAAAKLIQLGDAADAEILAAQTAITNAKNIAISDAQTAITTAKNTALASITTLTDAQLQRIIDIANGRYFPSMAAGLSYGVASAAISAGGSGGTNGDYDVPTNGGGGTAGVIRVRVSGNAITAILGVRTPGYNFTSNPTFDTSGIPGLTGATLTGTRQLNNPLGTFFVVSPSTNVVGAAYDVYEVTVAGTTAVLRGSAPVSSKASLTVSKIKASVATGGGTLAALFLPQLGVGLAAPGIAQTWTDQSDNALVADQVGHTQFSGADPKPVVTADGLYMNAQTGLTIHSGVVDQTSNIALFYAVKFPVPTAYASKALMDADTQTQGLVQEVTGGDLTTISSAISRVVNSTYSEAQLIRGLYQREWNNSNVSLRPIFYAKGPGSEYMQLTFNKVGQPVLSHFGSVSVDDTWGFGQTANPALGPSAFDGKMHLIGILIKDGIARIVMDGYQIGAKPFAGALSITTLNAFYINGNARVANATTPVSGTRHTCGGFAALKNITPMVARDVYNHLADLLGVKRYEPPKRYHMIFSSGQSLDDGSIITGSDWIGPDGSIGELSAEHVNSGSPYNITREFMPNVFAHYVSGGGIRNPKYFGPLGILTASNGVPAYAFCSGGGVETHDFGFAKAIISNAKWPKDAGLVFASAANGSPTTNIISVGNVVNRSSPAVRPLSTIGVPFALLTVYEQFLAHVRYANDWAIENGGVLIVQAWYDAQGFAGMTAAQMQALLVAFSADVKQITNQSVNVDGIGPQVNVSTNGTDNLASAVLDQAKLDADTARGTSGVYYYCVGPNSQFSAHVHYWGRYNYRVRGWIAAKDYGKAWLQGIDFRAVYPKSIIRGSNYVDYDYSWLERGLALVLGQTNYHIPSVIQTGGVDTHGYEYSGGGLTITNVDFVNVAATISIANPGSVAWTAHGLPEGTPVSFETTGALPTGLTAGNRTDKTAAVYYVVNPTTNAFNVALTPGGAAIQTTGTQSGVHTVYRRNRTRVTVNGSTAAGHTVSYARANSRGGNLATNEALVCPFPYWDTTQPVVSGRQLAADGVAADGRQWGCHFGPLTLT